VHAIDFSRRQTCAFAWSMSLQRSSPTLFQSSSCPQRYISHDISKRRNPSVFQRSQSSTCTLPHTHLLGGGRLVTSCDYIILTQGTEDHVKVGATVQRGRYSSSCLAAPYLNSERFPKPPDKAYHNEPSQVARSALPWLRNVYVSENLRFNYAEGLHVMRHRGKCFIC